MRRKRSRKGNSRDGSDDLLIERIDNRQLMLALFMMRATISIATLPVLTTGNSAQDAWAASLLVILENAIIVLTVGGLGLKFKDMTVIQYSTKLLGKAVGTIVSIGFLLMFLHFAATDVRIYSELLIAGFVPNTPMAFIIASMVALAAFAVYLGIETVGRVADVLAPLFALSIILGLAGGLMAFDSRGLEPILARGIKPVLSSTLTPLAFGGRYIALAVLLPVVTRPSRVLISAMASVVLSGLILVATSLSVVAVLGPDLGHNAIFPFFKVLRSVRVTELFQRAEALAVVSWGFGVLIDASLFLYCGSVGMSQLLRLEDNRSLLGPMAVIWVLYSIHSYDTIFDVIRFYEPNVFLPIVAVTVFVPYVLMWAAYGVRTLRARRKGLSEDPR